MEMFALDEEVTRMEAALPTLLDATRLNMLIQLAWQLRQRDSKRASALADEAKALLEQIKLPPAQRQSNGARLKLVQGEIKWLHARLDAAEELANQALQEYTGLLDDPGCADAHWLLSWIARDRGKSSKRDAEMTAAAAHARLVGDQSRVDLFEAGLARAAVTRDVDAAQEQWGPRFTIEPSNFHPSVTASINDFLGLAAKHSNNFGRAITHWMQTYEATLCTGEIRRAIVTAVNIGDAFKTLNDHQAALEWTQRGLDLARPTDWPGCIGGCLMQTAETLRQLGRLDAALELLRVALTTLAALNNSRNYALALHYLGNLALDRGNYASALNSFRQLQQRADALDQSDLQTLARRDQAHALSQLDRPEEALTVAAVTLELATQQNDPFNQIAALRVLAEVHSRHTLDAPSGMSAPTPTLHYLQYALAIACGIDGYTVPGDLLDAIADAYVAAGNYGEAFNLTRRANSAREKTHSQEATNRAIAMQVQHQTERARAEGEHLRLLAESEAKRAEVLQQTNATLAHLGAIGQEITAHLDANAVFQTLNRHVHSLLNTNYFVIYLSDPDGLSMTSAFRVQGGAPLPSTRVLLSDPSAYTAQCVRERREVLIDMLPGETNPNYTPDALPTFSALFAPLMIHDRVLGVMSIQSMQRHAYGERERLIFRSLCAYGAIALDNANAYLQLQEAQARLVAQEKLAALGSLVAGVAHELNTPLSNSLIIAGSLQQKTEMIECKMQQKNILRSDLLLFIDDTQEASELIMRGLSSAAELVSSFKQVAVDRTTAHRRVFDLQQTSHEIIATLMSQIRPSGHDIGLNIPEGISMNSYPGPFGQVISNFIENALLHAFEGREEGQMYLSAHQTGPGRVQIQFSDDGIGIAEKNLKRIFDPFFTTKMGRGGSGLGLNISYNIVTSLLRGQIDVNSVLDKGTTFILDLPLCAQEQASNY